MKTKLTALVMALLLALSAASFALADDLEGKWSGSAKASALPISLSASATFENGTFKVSIFGLTATGTYEAADDVITVKPTAFTGLLASQLDSADKIGSFAVAYKITDGKLEMSASTHGIDGTMSLNKK